ncbi:NAD+ synthase [Candidatus Gottesmanbacteria bacterium]|nr:NAD+ synthase [Candidatus Gottesmanbacteria bacterium]
MEFLNLDPKKEELKIISFLKTSLNKTPFTNYIVAVSGGIDSAVVTTILVKAVSTKHLFTCFFPYGYLSKDSLYRAKTLCDQLSIPTKNRIEIDIKNIVDPILTSIQPAKDLVRTGNVMARVRMILLFDQAKKHKALVCGTENKSEHLLGYFTRFGDEASDIEPIRHLYKTQVKILAKHLNIPKGIQNAIPTAGLWQNQTDETEFGFSYEEADKVLSLKFDHNSEEREIIKKGISQEVVQKVLKRAAENSFKYNLPYTLE